MTELWSLRLSGDTPKSAPLPSLRGPALPRLGLSVDCAEYAQQAGVIYLDALEHRAGPFDLAPEGIWLTVRHTIERVARGVA